MASTSGKMSSNLMDLWLREVFIPALREGFNMRTMRDVIEAAQGRISSPSYDSLDDPNNEEEDFECHRNFTSRVIPATCPDSLRSPNSNRNVSEPIAGPSWIEKPQTVEHSDQIMQDRCLVEQLAAADRECLPASYALLLADTWTGYSSERMRTVLRRLSISFLQIPKQTTGEVQPLDVGFFRQYKILLQRITKGALMDERVSDITNRDGVVNIISLTWNQLSADAYNDLIRSA